MLQYPSHCYLSLFNFLNLSPSFCLLIRLQFMFEVVFNKISVSKPNRYVILIKTAQQTKRTDVCSLWTSNPQFSPLSLSELSPMEIKLCQATLDRKIRVIGIGTVREQQLRPEEQVVFEGEVRLEHEIQGKMACAGLVHLMVRRQRQYEAIAEPMTRQLKTQISQMQPQAQAQEVEEEQDFDLQKQQKIEQGQEEDEEEEDVVRVEVHCGFNFFLGSEFYVQVIWGNKSSFRTRSIRDKITPFWAQGGRVTGRPTVPITLHVRDSKNNILQSFKFSLSSLRTLFPYHLRLLFREQYLGATPELYFSLIRESAARHSITQLPLRFGMRNVGEPIRNAMYLMVSLSITPKVPTFMSVDRSQNCTLEQANVFLTSRTAGDDERVDLVGLANNQTPKGLSIFKSYLTRKIHMFLIFIGEARPWFAGSLWESCRVIDNRGDFETVLKKVYYQGESFTIKKMLEFFNPNTIEEANTQGKSVAERWKLLTRNYILRNKMVNQSTRHIQELKQAIKNKGVELVEIKKILKQIKTVNFGLVGKEKLMTAIKNRSRVGKVYAKEIDTGGLISALYQKQAILEGQKRINAELALRMDSLTQVQENQEDLSRQVTANAAKLLQQQQKISKMKRMEQAIKQQRVIIGQLQHRFQRSQMDKRVNEALQQQRDRLDKLRERKQEDLKKVYKIIKENNQQGGNLFAKVKHAQETLIKLNEQYARLTTL